MADPKLDELYRRIVGSGAVDPMAHMREIMAAGVVKVAGGGGGGGGPDPIPHAGDPAAIMNAALLAAPFNLVQGPGQIPAQTQMNTGYPPFGDNATVSQPSAMGRSIVGQTQPWPASRVVQMPSMLPESPNPADANRWVLDHIAQQEVGSDHATFASPSPLRGHGVVPILPDGGAADYEDLPLNPDEPLPPSPSPSPYPPNPFGPYEVPDEEWEKMVDRATKNAAEEERKRWLHREACEETIIRGEATTHGYYPTLIYWEDFKDMLLANPEKLVGLGQAGRLTSLAGRTFSNLLGFRPGGFSPPAGIAVWVTLMLAELAADIVKLNRLEAAFLAYKAELIERREHRICFLEGRLQMANQCWPLTNCPSRASHCVEAGDFQCFGFEPVSFIPVDMPAPLGSPFMGDDWPMELTTGWSRWHYHYRGHCKCAL